MRIRRLYPSKLIAKVMGKQAQPMECSRRLQHQRQPQEVHQEDLHRQDVLMKLVMLQIGTMSGHIVSLRTASRPVKNKEAVSQYTDRQSDGKASPAYGL